MIKVFVKKQSSYPVSTTNLKKNLSEFLSHKGIVSDAEVFVMLVGEKRMLDISKKYLKDKNLHNVLSFTAAEAKDFVFPPDGIIHLGEIVVCFPQAFKEAKMEGKLIEEKVQELVNHGALHLLGVHHN